MRSPARFYTELVDGAAFDKAESGERVTQYDVPVAPLLFPWVVAGPALALLRLNDFWSTIVFSTGLAASVGSWAAFALFYYRRVQHYRRQTNDHECA